MGGRWRWRRFLRCEWEGEIRKIGVVMMDDGGWRWRWGRSTCCREADAGKGILNGWPWVSWMGRVDAD